MTMADTDPVLFAASSKQSYVDAGSLASSLLSARTDIPGSRVCNSLGDDLGTADDVLLDAHSGKAVFVLLHIGGVLGFGGTVVPVPYERFRYDATSGAWITDLSLSELNSVPETEDGWFRDEDNVREIKQHYGE